jgi:hypothetical protein
MQTQRMREVGRGLPGRSIPQISGKCRIEPGDIGGRPFRRIGRKVILRRDRQWRDRRILVRSISSGL